MVNTVYDNNDIVKAECLMNEALCVTSSVGGTADSDSCLRAVACLGNTALLEAKIADAQAKVFMVRQQQEEQIRLAQQQHQQQQLQLQQQQQQHAASAAASAATVAMDSSRGSLNSMWSQDF